MNSGREIQLEINGVPVRVPAPVATVTAPVNVTDWPKTDGPTDAVTAVVVVPCATVWVIAALVLPLKFVSPP